MKLLAIVVTYYPDVTDAIINIKQYIDFVDKLIIWENTPIKDREIYKIEIPDYSSKILFLGTDKNEGMAYALNQGVKWGIQNKYTHILTMDQDSYFIDFMNYKLEVQNNFKKKEIGAFSPNVNNERSEICDIEIEPYSITSGSFYDLNIFSKVGGFRNDYFIDGVDTEFCLRLRKNNFIIVTLCKCHLKQQYGDFIESKFGLSSANYSAFRCYYIVRNHIWIWKEYRKMIPFNFKKFLIWDSLVKKIITITLQESNKYAKYKSLLKGLYDGLKKKKQIELDLF